MKSSDSHREPVDAAEFSRILRTRRTINDFMPQRPPEAALMQAIELATWAPNHKLTEPWRFHLLGDRSIAAIVELNSRITAQTKGTSAAEIKRERWSKIPGWLVVTCIVGDDPVRDQENQAAVCCAIQNLLLSLWSLGIGTKWSTGEILRTAEFAEILQIDPTSERILALIWYGYPNSIPESRRRPVAEVIRRHS